MDGVNECFLLLLLFFISPARSQTKGCILANRHHVFAVCFLEAGFTEPLAGGRLFAQSKQPRWCWDFINQGEKHRLGLGAGSQAPSAATSWAQPAVLGLRGRIRPWCNPAGCWLWVRPNTKWDRRETPALGVPLWGDVCGPPLLVLRLPWARRGAQLGDSGQGGCKEPWGQRTSPSQQDPKRCGAIWASSLPYGDKWRAACARTRLGSTGQHFWCAPSLQEHPAQPQQLPVPLGPAAVLPRHSQPKWLPQKPETAAAPPRPAPCRRSAGVVTG